MTLADKGALSAGGRSVSRLESHWTRRELELAGRLGEHLEDTLPMRAAGAPAFLLELDEEGGVE